MVFCFYFIMTGAGFPWDFLEEGELDYELRVRGITDVGGDLSAMVRDVSLEKR